MRHIVLYSGGPDSFITLSKLRYEEDSKDVVSVYFDLGHRYREAERRAVLLTDPGTIFCTELEGLGTLEDDDAYIWHRNAFLCIGASRFALSKSRVYLTVQKDELSIVDRRLEFLFSMGNLFRSLGQRIEVVTPWAEHDKTDMVNSYLDAGGSVQKLKQTWSCYSPKYDTQGVPVHCGNCPACVRRYIAFYLSGIYTFSDFAIDPKLGTVAKDYLDAVATGKYSGCRSQRIVDALG